MIVYEVDLLLKSLDKLPLFEKFMSKKHVDDLMKTGCFLSASFSKINESGKYRATYLAKDQVNLDLYLNEYAQNLREEFKTTLQEIEIEVQRNTFSCLYFK